MDEPVEALRRIGLTEWGARAYQSLVGLGQSDAATVAEAAQLPRTRIYGVLDELVQKGWATCSNTRPKTFRAERPFVCFEKARDELLTKLQHAEDHLEAFYRQDGARFGGPMWTLTGAEAIQSRLTSMVKTARSSFFLALPFSVPGDERLFEKIRQAVQRGVHVRILVSDPKTLPRSDGPLGEIRTGIVPTRVAFMDEKQACIMFRRPGHGGRPDYKGIWNPHSDMVEQLKDIAMNLWEQTGAQGDPDLWTAA